MAYKTLLTVLLRPEDAHGPLTVAIALADRCDAHLEVLCLGSDPTPAAYSFEGGVAFSALGGADEARERAQALLAAARERLQAEEIRWSAEGLVSQAGNLGLLMADRARYADLVVLPRPYDDVQAPEGEAILEAALFEARVPVLVLPQGTLAVPPPAKVLLAWNGSDEALSAARAALPFLVTAAQVTIVVVDPPRQDGDPGAGLAQWLTRHGATVDVAVLARTRSSVSQEISRHAEEVGADLIVMGAYGHSRLREAILGGATRDTLESAKIPVLMAR